MGHCISLTLPCREKASTIAFQESQFTYSLFTAIAEVGSAWDNLLPAGNLMLSRRYLQSLEESTGSEVKYRYLVICRDRIPVGAGFFQIINFKGSNVEKDGTHGKNSITDFVNRNFRRMLVSVVNRISLNLLVSGNAFVTGEYGFYFADTVKTDKALFQAVSESIDKIIAESGVKISGILIKDYYETGKTWMEDLKHTGFLEFRVNPNMILDIRDSWNTFEGYLGDMASKYRTRMRKALKRADSLTVREMTAAELHDQLPKISLLYDQVVDEAAFKLAKLDIAYILRLKEGLGENFGVIGFFRDDELVTFISYCLHDEELVAGYMGMNRSINNEYDLYMNVLLQLAKKGIGKRMKRVVYGRTAMEIKSSVGAVPHPMYLYVKHRSPLVNFIIRQVVRYLARDEQWTLRSPFKDADN